MIVKKCLKDVVILKPQGVIMGGPETAELRTTLEELLAKDRRKIVVDLREVKWINAAGIGVLVAALTRLRETKGDLKLACGSGSTRAILHLLKMEHLFQSHNSPDSAVASFV